MKKLILISSVLIFILLLWFYPTLDALLIQYLHPQELTRVASITDGDTVKLTDGTIVRMLGINTPEKGELYSAQAKNFTTQQLLNQSVTLTYGKDKTDRYGRTLGYVFVHERMVNRELVARGFANPYFPSGRDQYTTQFFDAWDTCIQNANFICEHSTHPCASCITLQTFNRYTETIALANTCAHSCDLSNWDIKDEGRKHFKLPTFTLATGETLSIIVGNLTNTKDTLYWNTKDYVWTDSGDTIYLRDAKGFLVLWNRTGY